MGDETFTCEICIEEALSTQKFSHDTNCVLKICFACIGSHIQAKIDENMGTINCPGLNCGKTLDPLECQPMIPSTLFVKWCDCLCKSSISMFKSSYCPNPSCSELILNECDEATTKCTCLGCKTLFCYTCRVPWHAGFWCRESRQERDANDVQFGLLIERMMWSRCPGCGQPIERIDGCNYVLCRCGTRFCHKCGLDHHFSRCGERGITCCLRIFMFFFLLFIIYAALTLPFWLREKRGSGN